jgi:hypothetical protein
MFKRRLETLSPIDEVTIKPALEAALKERKIEKASTLTVAHWGMPYDDFRQSKSQFPDDLFRADMFAISQIDLGIHCIVAGFLDDGMPMLLDVTATGAEIMDDFAVAGEGAALVS